VAIGTLPMASDVLVPQAVAQVLGQRSQRSISVKDGTYESLTRLLREADIDFMAGPLRGSAVAGDLQEETLFVDRLVAVVRRDHPLLRETRRPSLRRLARYPWIGPLPGTPAHGAFERLLAQEGLETPAVALRAHSTAVVRSVLLSGNHVALLSPLQVHVEVQAGLLAYACSPLPGTERAIGITQRRDALASPAGQEVLAALRRVAADAHAGLR
jgi:LysR family transcriptional regulator of gallate degradation